MSFQTTPLFLELEIDLSPARAPNLNWVTNDVVNSGI